MPSREHPILLPKLMLCLLAAVLIFAAAAARGADEAQASLDTLQTQLDHAYTLKDYTKALKIAEQMDEILMPKYVDLLYRITALQCLLGHKEEAYVWLKRTFDAGFWDFARFKDDPDFASIREEERFQKMAKQARIEQYLEMLERPEREEFQKPKEVMKALALKPGERVADVGAGSGYFTLPVAEAVGPKGTVWAVDIRQEMLDYIQKRLVEKNLHNVTLVLAPKDDPLLPAGGVDTILMVDTWHYIRDPQYAKKLRAALAPGGRVVVIDYIPKPWEDRPWGPPPEQQTPREELDRHFAEAGLKPIKVHDFLTEQYFVEYGAK
jgi:ubiquinone/menaquinone biosynthesis C-methylase UbiE